MSLTPGPAVLPGMTPSFPCLDPEPPSNALIAELVTLVSGVQSRVISLRRLY
jgi:hypothetical protein